VTLAPDIALQVALEEHDSLTRQLWDKERAPYEGRTVDDEWHKRSVMRLRARRQIVAGEIARLRRVCEGWLR
jgi:hypothetical protein